MEKIFAYGSPEEEELQQKQQAEAYKHMKGSPGEEKEGLPEKLFSKTKKRELDVKEIPLSVGTLKIGLKIEDPEKKGKKTPRASFKLTEGQRDIFKGTAEAALAKAEVSVIRFGPDLELKIGLDLFKVDSDGNFNMAQATIAMPVKIFKKGRVESIGLLSPFASMMSERAELHVEIKLEIDLSHKEAKALKLLQLKKSEVDAVGGEVARQENTIEQLKEQKLKSKAEFYQEKLEKLGLKSKDELSPKQAERFDRQFNKTCEGLRDEIIAAKNKLRDHQNQLKRLEQKARDLSGKIKSPLLKKLNRAFLKKIGALLAKLGKALDGVEVIYSVLKILILLWSGAKLKILKGENFDDISLNEMSELLMQTMHDKITGKKRVEDPDYTTDNIEEAGRGGSSGDGDSVSEIQAELQNFISLHGKSLERAGGPKAGSKPGGGNGGETETGSKETDTGAPSADNLSKPGNMPKGTEGIKTDKEMSEGAISKEDIAKKEIANISDNSPTITIQENAENKELLKVKKIVAYDFSEGILENENGKEIKNKKVQIIIPSQLKEGEQVIFVYSFQTTFKGETIEFSTNKIKEKLTIKTIKDVKWYVFELGKSRVFDFQGGRFCLPKDSIIKYKPVN